MKKMFLIMLSLMSPTLNAQVLLLPHSLVPITVYLEKCKSEGYICSHDYFRQMILDSESADFNKFIEHIDLYNEDYRKNLFVQIKQLLSKENLSIEQVVFISKIIERAHSIQKNDQLNLINTEIRELIHDLENTIEERSDTEYYIIYKKVLSKNQYSQIKYKIKFSRVLKISPYNEPHAVFDLSNPLVKGTCDDAIYSQSIKYTKDLKYISLFEDECESTKAFTAATTSPNLFKKYQTPLIYTAAGLLLVSFFSQYKVSLSF